MISRIRNVLLTAIAISLSSCDKKEPVPEDKLIGEWSATVKGTRIGLVFEAGNRMTAIEGTMLFKGRYKADFSKTPAVLEFYDDRHPDEARYSLLELAGDNTLRTTLASSKLVEKWEEERTMILDRKSITK